MRERFTLTFLFSRLFRSASMENPRCGTYLWIPRNGESLYLVVYYLDSSIIGAVWYAIHWMLRIIEKCFFRMFRYPGGSLVLSDAVASGEAFVLCRMGIT